MGEQCSNYEKLCETWRLKFLEMDQHALMNKLSCLSARQDYLTISYYHQVYGIHRTSGEIIVMETGYPASIDTCMNIYNLLWFSTEHAAFSGKWVPFKELRNASVFGPAFQRNVLDSFALTFTGHLPELAYACRQLGGEQISSSDMGYQLPSFDCIPIQVLFWEGDEEFPAAANILFDTSATDFIHVESTVTIASDGVIRLANAAGLPLRGSIYGMN